MAEMGEVVLSPFDKAPKSICLRMTTTSSNFIALRSWKKFSPPICLDTYETETGHGCKAGIVDVVYSDEILFILCL